MGGHRPRDADVILAAAAELALATGTRMVEPAAAEAAADARGLDHDRFLAAAIDLRDRGLLQVAVAEPSQVVLLAMTNAGLLHHLESTHPDLAAVRDRLRQAARAAAGKGPVLLAEQVGEPPLLVECLLDAMVSGRQLVYSKAPGRRFRIHRVLS